MSSLGWRIKKCKHGYLKSVRAGRICRKVPKSRSHRSSKLSPRAKSTTVFLPLRPPFTRTIRAPIHSLVRDQYPPYTPPSFSPGGGSSGPGGISGSGWALIGFVAIFGIVIFIPKKA